MDIRFAALDFSDKRSISCLVLNFGLRMRYDALKRRDPRVQGLTEFDADKTMRMLHKVWRNRPDPQAREARGLIPFFPVMDLDGKHGHRIAFPSSDGRPRAVLLAMQRLDERGPRDGVMLATLEDKREWGVVELLVPQVTLSRLLADVKNRGFLDDTEVEFLERFGAACGDLTEPEMVAVGRHEDAAATEQSLLYEINRWYGVTTEALNALEEYHARVDRRSRDEAARLLWQCWSFALECKKKAGILGDDIYGSDSIYYETGMESLVSAVSEQGLSADILSSQASAAEIWDDPRLKVLRLPAFCIWRFSTYLAGCVCYLDAFQGSLLRSHLSSVTPADVKSAYSEVARFGKIPKGMWVEEFNTGWDSAFAVPKAGLVVDLSPTDLWDGSVGADLLVAVGRQVIDWLRERYIAGDVLRLRVQPA